MRINFKAASGALLALVATSVVHAGEWEPLIGEDILRDYISGLTVERQLPGGETATGEYYADGTGLIREYGGSFPRTWTIKGDDQLCIASDNRTQCYVYEKNTRSPGLYRGREVSSEIWIEFKEAGKRARPTGSVDEVGPEGGPAVASVDDIARELSNPNTPMASLNFKLQFRSFEGDLPNANNQNSTTVLFQPSLPFPLENGGSILFRPAIPLLLGQPVFNANKLDFEGETGLGDIAFDLAYAKTSDAGILTAFGVISSLPTATNGLGSKRFTLGPEFLIGKLTSKYVLGVFPNHQWDIGGSGDADINLTSIQLFGTYLPDGGWNIGSAPVVTYDHITDQWTVPINFQFGKTIVAGGRPWKLAIEVNYYVEQADAFGPEWMIGFNVSPVVKNGLVGWFK